MNLQAKYPTTPDEFLRWNEGREGKREFVNGRVVEMMINVTRNHARLTTRLLLALAKALDTSRFDVGAADFGVRTPDGIRYPDVFVDRVTTETSGADLATTHPVLLAEILSASSYNRDFGEKVADYTALPTLQQYLILAQDEARAWIWTRSGENWLGPLQVAGIAEKIHLSRLEISLDLDALYRGIVDQSAE